MNEKDLESVKKIVSDLFGNGLLKAGMALSFAKAEEQAKVTYLSALVEQNWIIIRQLDRISKCLSDQDYLNEMSSKSTNNTRTTQSDLSDSIKDISKSTWKCPTCGHTNSNSQLTCNSCKLTRPSSTL